MSRESLACILSNGIMTTLMNSRVLIFFSTLALIVSTTTIIFLWSKGFTFNRETRRIEKVGMISVKSAPEGARIYLDGVLTSATNTTIGNLKNGVHKLRIEKEGHNGWEKDVPVKEELVTFVDVVLVPRSVEIKPLTTAGVISPILGSSKDRIYFIAKVPADVNVPQKSGIYSLDLNTSIFNMFKANASLILPDGKNLLFSAAESIELSPEDTQMLIRMNEKGYYLANLGGGEQPTATSTSEPTKKVWDKELLEKRVSLVDKFKLTFDLAKIATDSATIFSPDEKKFIYRKKNEKGDSWQYSVRILGDLLGVGEKEEYAISTVALNSQTRFFWYPDSKRVITSECGQFSEKGVCASGTIHLMDVDGTNNTQIYQGSLSSDLIFPTPDGSKIIILASFSQVSPPNLYAISLR